MIEIYRNLFIGVAEDYESQVKGKPDWVTVHACKEPYHRRVRRSTRGFYQMLRCQAKEVSPICRPHKWTKILSIMAVVSDDGSGVGLSVVMFFAVVESEKI